MATKKIDQIGGDVKSSLDAAEDRADDAVKTAESDVSGEAKSIETKGSGIAHEILAELEALIERVHHFEDAGLILKLRADAKAIIERLRAAI